MLKRDLYELLTDQVFKFTLTGSRRSGTAQERSDWDLFVRDSPGLS